MPSRSKHSTEANQLPPLACSLHRSDALICPQGCTLVDSAQALLADEHHLTDTAVRRLEQPVWLEREAKAN